MIEVKLINNNFQNGEFLPKRKIIESIVQIFSAQKNENSPRGESENKTNGG